MELIPFDDIQATTTTRRSIPSFFFNHSGNDRLFVEKCAQLLVVFTVLFSVGSVELLAQESSTKRVLFLGNSVFYSRGGLYPAFEGFCKEAGLDYQAVSQWNTPANDLGVEFLNYGRIPLNLPAMASDAKIHALIRSGNFDFVILEGRRSGFLLPDTAGLPENRGEPIPYQTNIAALGSLHRTIAESGAQTVLYMHPGQRKTAHIKHPLAQIYRRFHSDLEEMEINGKRHDVILVPAMLLWLDTLNRYGVEAWYADSGHGNALARYSSACMLYTYLTGNDPRKNRYKALTELTRTWELIPGKADMSASEEDAKWIKDQVWLYYSTRFR